MNNVSVILPTDAAECGVFATDVLGTFSITG